MHPADVGRHLALRTPLSETQARAAYSIALHLAGGAADRALKLVLDVHKIHPGNTLGALSMLVAPPAEPDEPALTAAQVRRITTRLIDLLWPVAYHAGAVAAYESGTITPPGPAPRLREHELTRYADNAEVINAALGRPPEHQYHGGAVTWDVSATDGPTG